MIDIKEKVRKVEEAIAERNKPKPLNAVKDSKFRDSLPSAILERVEKLEERVTNLENNTEDNLKGEQDGIKKRGRPKREDINTDVTGNV